MDQAVKKPANKKPVNPPVGPNAASALGQSWIELLREWLGIPTAKEKDSWEPVAQRRKMAERPPSFTDLLPYLRYLPDERVYTLKDGSSLGVMFELGTLPTEAQPLEYLADRANRIKEALQALPESDTSPWVVQFFLNDDRDIESLNDSLRAYIAQVHERDPARGHEILQSPYTQSVLQEVRKHL